MTQDSLVNGISSTINYDYDDANRLESVDSVPYSYDDNGNLLNDGQNIYVYDSANRLISVNGTTLYTYNGLGDRLSQTVDSQTTNYTLNLNAGLTQVLGDGINTYTYGLGRISQKYATATEYFLGDALGSVRQLTDDSGSIAFAQSYDPYGTVRDTSPLTLGTFSIYGYTGEPQDPSGMVYLRARYYDPVDGRFMSRDIWDGDVNNPLSLNRWMYVVGNPVNLIDPSGLNPECWNEMVGVVAGGGQICAIERFNEILNENSNNGVKALASLFTDNELQNMGGFYAGTTSATRLEWILKVTLGSDKKWLLDLGSKITCALPGEFIAFHFQFAISFPSGDNSGLADELEDSQFYDGTTWIKQESNQIAHFLTAVGEYYYKGRDLQLIIAHEKSTDPCDAETKETMSEKWECYNDLRINITNEVTSVDRSHFYKAWHYDTNGMYAKRDQELWAILGFDPARVINLGDVDRARQGNSLQDLRLSLRGVRFADWIMSNRSSDPNEAGQWLSANLPLP